MKKVATTLVLGILLTFLAAAVEVPASHRQLMEQEARAQHVPVTLVLLLCDSESHGNPDAVNKNRDEAGNVTSIDVGYFQLNSLCWEWFAYKFYPEGEFDPYRVACNIKTGIRYFAWLYRQFGSFEDALTAYKGGPTRLFRGGDIPEARALAKVILTAWVNEAVPFKNRYFS